MMRETKRKDKPSVTETGNLVENLAHHTKLQLTLNVEWSFPFYANLLLMRRVSGWRHEDG